MISGSSALIPTVRPERDTFISIAPVYTLVCKWVSAMWLVFTILRNVLLVFVSTKTDVACLLCVIYWKWWDRLWSPNKNLRWKVASLNFFARELESVWRIIPIPFLVSLQFLSWCKIIIKVSYFDRTNSFNDWWYIHVPCNKETAYHGWYPITSQFVQQPCHLSQEM